MDEIQLALAQISFLSLKEKIILRKNLDSLDKLALMSMEDISQAVGRVVNPEFWNGKQIAAEAKKSAYIMQHMGIRAVLYDEAEYPALLREIFNPPYMLFYRGEISVLAKKCVSVVGTRRICRECAQAAFSFAKDAALDGLTVVSGLAYGTDTYAHKGALAAVEAGGCTGTTAAILPCGIDTIVPSANKTLVQHILKTGGCVASEYIPGTDSEPWRFVQRNRIIAALSPATVVIQAPPGSGALLTAQFAIEENRELFFHTSGQCEEAKKTERVAEQLLKASKKSGKAFKLEHTSERYVTEGAHECKDYADFVRELDAPPGKTRSNKEKQPGLF
jgi:DNA processing protein